MSIVGTRPPLISETNLYEPRHKARLACSNYSLCEKLIDTVIEIQKDKALCGNYVGGVLGVPHGLLSGGVLLIKMFDKL